MGKVLARKWKREWPIFSARFINTKEVGLMSSVAIEPSSTFLWIIESSMVKAILTAITTTAYVIIDVKVKPLCSFTSDCAYKALHNEVKMKTYRKPFTIPTK
ncbi:MAG: hypothetical protein SCALA701_04920 [Candidatus Scalindua sp.]|nr:MAG: hypothetical protein SCALA701_04920 [Candidatus Scalindua sp.]